MRCAAVLLALGLVADYSAAETPSWQELTVAANEAQSRGLWAAAEQYMEEAWTVIQRTGAGEEDFPSGVEMVVNFYNAEGQGLKADAVLRGAETAVEQLPPRHPNRLAILTIKAQTYDGQGRAIEALPVHEQLLSIQVKMYGPDSMEARGSLEMLAHSHDRSGELEKAEALFQRLNSMTFRDSQRLVVIDGPRFHRRGRFCCASFGVTGVESSSLADFYDRHGRFADAEKAYQAAIARAERDDAEKHGLEAALGAYQNFLRSHRRFAEAQQIQARIMERHQNTGNPPDPYLDFADRVGQASLYLEAEQYDEANKVYEKALTHFGTDSGQYGNLLQNYASALIQQGKLDQAEGLVQELEQHATSDPNDYTHEGALSLLAQIREKAGDQKGGEAYRTELTAIQRSRGSVNDFAAISDDIAGAQASLSQGNVDQAWSTIERVLTRIESEGILYMGFLNQVAGLSGSFPEKNRELADRLIDRVLAIQDRMLPPSHPLYDPGLAANYARHPVDAARIWSKHILALESANGSDSLRLVDPLNQLANLLQQERPREAAAMVRRALNVQEKTSGPNSEAVLSTLARLASMYFDVGDLAGALEACEREIGLSGRLYGRTTTHAHNLASAAQIYAQWQQFDHALELAREALEIASQPEYASETEFFRGLLDTLEKQKAAVVQSR
jgi:tetratricopeptide (TPR) repeat protein